MTFCCSMELIRISVLEFICLVYRSTAITWIIKFILVLLLEVLVSFTKLKWTIFQVAIRNIRRDAIKAYEKLEKVCLENTSIDISSLGPPWCPWSKVALLAYVVLDRRKSFQKTMWKICQVICRWRHLSTTTDNCANYQSSYVFQVYDFSVLFYLYIVSHLILCLLDLIYLVFMQKVTDEYMKKMESIQKQKEKVCQSVSSLNFTHSFNMNMHHTLQDPNLSTPLSNNATFNFISFSWCHITLLIS